MRTADIETGKNYGYLAWVTSRENPMTAVAERGGRVTVTDRRAGGKVDVRYPDGSTGTLSTRQIIAPWSEVAAQRKALDEQRARSAAFHAERVARARVATERLRELLGDDLTRLASGVERPLEGYSDGSGYYGGQTYSPLSAHEVLALVEAGIAIGRNQQQH